MRAVAFYVAYVALGRAFRFDEVGGSSKEVKPKTRVVIFNARANQLASFDQSLSYVGCRFPGAEDVDVKGARMISLEHTAQRSLNRERVPSECHRVRPLRGTGRR